MQNNGWSRSDAHAPDLLHRAKKVCRSNDKPFFVLTARKFCPDTENTTFTAVSDLMQSQNRKKVRLWLIPPAHVYLKCCIPAHCGP